MRVICTSEPVLASGWPTTTTDLPGICENSRQIYIYFNNILILLFPADLRSCLAICSSHIGHFLLLSSVRAR